MRKVVYDFQVRNYRVLKLDEMPKLDYKKYSMDGKEYEPVTIYDAQNCIAIESKEEFCIVSKLHLLKLISRVEGADKILDYYRASKGAFLCIQKNKKILHYGYIIKQSL